MDPFEPEKSLFRTQAIGELLALAAKDVPELAGDQLTVGVVWKEEGLAVTGTVQVKDVTGVVVATFAKEGQKTLTGQIRWRF